jgi:uncharacterized protein
MKLAITGSSGLIGTAAREKFHELDWEVFRVVRRKADSDKNEIGWAPMNESIDLQRLEGMDAVIHLAGENIASGRWTKAKKNRIWESRVKSTQMLCRALSKLKTPPSALISASAVGYYGNRGEEWLDESSSTGSGFLPEVSRYWEAAAHKAKETGIRVINPRFGMVLSPRGGALGKMLLPFKLGLGGPVGNGKQYWSWVTLEDVVRFLEFALRQETLSGPVNVTSPEPVTNREFTKALGKVLKRPTVAPFPAFAAKLLFGQMAEDLLLASARVEPKKLKEAGFDFSHPELEPALKSILNSRKQ